jgi:uncharacterized membrane protein YjfL (UPF0719 family)
MEDMLRHAVQGFGFAIECGFFMWLAKMVFDLTTMSHYDPNYEIEENSNLAVGLDRAGLYLGIAIGMYGSVSSGVSHSFLQDSQALAVDGVMIVVFTLISRFLTNRVIIANIANQTALKQGNVAVGLVEASGYIATGLIMYGSVTGEGGAWWSIIVWFALGQLALLILVYLYEWMTPYKVVDNIKKGNVAAGLMLGGIMVAMGFILKGAISGPSLGWVMDLEAFAISLVNSIVLLLVIFHQLVDRIFLPGTTIKTEIERDQNSAAIAVVVSVKVAMALFISAIVL